MKKKFEILKSSGNLFTDLGFPDAQERMAKVDLAIQINKIIEKKKLTQKSAAEILGIDQPKISALNQGKLSGFSLERLFRFLNILGQDITIKVSPKKITQEKAQVSVKMPSRTKKVPVKPRTSSIPTSLQARKK